MTPSPLRLFLVDEDPVFRVGLQIWLDQRPEFQVIGEASDAGETLEQLTALQAAAAATIDAGQAESSGGLDGIIIDIGLGRSTDKMAGLQLCGEVKRQFPRLKILVLSAYGEPVLEAAARQMGADGFGQRGLPIRQLSRLIQQTVGEPADLEDVAQDVALPPLKPGLIASLHTQSLRQIEAAIGALEIATAGRQAFWYRWVLAGQHRELRAARWLVQRILPLPSDTGATPQADRRPNLRGLSRSRRPSGSLQAVGEMIPNPSPLLVATGDVRTRVCEAVFRKLQFPLENRSEIPLEIDILRPDRSRELLYTVLQAFESLLDDLQQGSVQPGQLLALAPDFLADLWRAVTVDFFGRYYTPSTADIEQPLVAVLEQDAGLVQAAILAAIPEVPALISHLLFQTALEIDGVSYVATTPEALRRSQFLLENLLIQVACGVMQPVLNRFADVESLKRSLYQRRILSARDITRFRNELSWRYRWDTLVNEPKAIFESQYRLLALTPQGIQAQWIYAPRQDELEALSGLPFLLTLALETRDAIAPRLRTAISFVGSGVVFLLTEVVGRGIGLIGRGVAKGVGSAWQDVRLRQRRDDL